MELTLLLQSLKSQIPFQFIKGCQDNPNILTLSLVNFRNHNGGNLIRNFEDCSCLVSQELCPETPSALTMCSSHYTLLNFSIPEAAEHFFETGFLRVPLEPILEL